MQTKVSFRYRHGAHGNQCVAIVIIDHNAGTYCRTYRSTNDVHNPCDYDVTPPSGSPIMTLYDFGTATGVPKAKVYYKPGDPRRRVFVEGLSHLHTVIVEPILMPHGISYTDAVAYCDSLDPPGTDIDDTDAYRRARGHYMITGLEIPHGDITFIGELGTYAITDPDLFAKCIREWKEANEGKE